MKSINPLPPPTGGSSGYAGLGRFLQQFVPRGLPFLIILVVLLLVFLYATCTQYIEPDQFAVKQVDVSMPLITGAAGIHSNIYESGIRWRMPGCEKFLILPKSVRAITLHSQGKSKEDGTKYVRYEDAAHIQTSDGFFINL